MTASEGPVLLEGVQTVEEQLRRLEARLLAEAGGDRAEEDVRRHLTLARARFGSARIRQFLPILIEPDVRRRLTGR
jgi:2'-5' RNA ligase